MFTHSEMVPLDDDLLFEIRADRFNFGHVVPPNSLCCIFGRKMGAKPGHLGRKMGYGW
jgi:hypothetical protein